MQGWEWCQQLTRWSVGTAFCGWGGRRSVSGGIRKSIWKKIFQTYNETTCLQIHINKKVAQNILFLILSMKDFMTDSQKLHQNLGSSWGYRYSHNDYIQRLYNMGHLSHGGRLSHEGCLSRLSCHRHYSPRLWVVGELGGVGWLEFELRKEPWSSTLKSDSCHS